MARNLTDFEGHDQGAVRVELCFACAAALCRRAAQGAAGSGLDFIAAGIHVIGRLLEGGECVLEEVARVSAGSICVVY